MRITSLQGPDGPIAALRVPAGLAPVPALPGDGNGPWPPTLDALLASGRFAALRAWSDAHAAEVAEVAAGEAGRALADAAPAALLAHPPKILGVGLNYAEHAGDLGETRPDEPATFMKPHTAILEPGGTIPIPRQSERTTGEAELALVIGGHGKDVPPERAADLIAGVTTAIDMTAEDILQRNPRFLTRAKSFDGFLVLGPDLVTLDDVHAALAETGEATSGGLDVGALEVTTTWNDAPVRRNVVANMLHDPASLVAFFSAVMPLEPGDVISTGTPGAVPLAHGGRVGCTIPGVGSVVCPVHDRKRDG
ncbi:MAG: fumarylacetoacetate hydrolase family protein [Trueperaceae bacterium]|nr:fumarylacetoacetate hydrolase family protein [Trueperaceae bacterium]